MIKKYIRPPIAPTSITIICCIFYWVYLYFTAHMVIRYDSIGYEKLGLMLNQDGWIEYFRTGPHREPLYPLLISICMNIGRSLSIPYLFVQKLLQLFMLFATQLLFLIALKKLKVKTWIIVLSLLYLGFSPAIVNTALSLYSEIITLPLILVTVLLATRAWKILASPQPLTSIFYHSFLLSVCLIGVTLTKGIYEYIFFIFLTPFLFRITRAFFLKKKTEFITISLFVIVCTAAFTLSIHVFKSLNKKYNGSYTLTDSRGAFSIYASAARRTEDLTFTQLLAGIAYTAGKGCCESIFKQKACYFWGIENYDTYGLSMLSKVSQDHPKDKVSGIMVNLAKERIMQKPVQFTALTALEAVKMFFWESTQIGFVEYAPWQTKLYSFTLFKNVLRASISLLSISAFLYTFFYIVRNKKHILDFSPEGESAQTAGFILLIMSGHIGMYSLFMTIPRFILPITPLYLLIIAFALDRISNKNIKRPVEVVREP